MGQYATNEVGKSKI